MDRESLRQFILDSDRQVMNHPVIWNHMNDQQKKVFLAGQALWQENTPTTNAALDRMVALYNQQNP